MNLKLFEEIIKESNELFKQYSQVAKDANYIPDDPPRKEDRPSYWVAYVAYNRGYSDSI